MAQGDPLALLKAHGANATSFQLLEPGIEHWFSGQHDAFVGYANTGRAWVVLGEPVAAPSELADVRAELEAAAKLAGRRLRYFALETLPESATKAIVIGEQPEWSRGAWQAALSRKRSLREQLRRARAKGVTVSCVEACEIRDQLEKLASEWRKTRSMATMHFAVRLDLLHHAGERRYFVARHGDEIVAALIAVPIYARNGWLVEDLLRASSSPNGTAELLFDAAVCQLENEGAAVITMGLAPLSGISNRTLTAVRALTPWLFDWHGLRAFKAKLGPDRWKPIYAAWPEREMGPTAVIDILRCFAGGSLFRFAARTLLHRYRAVLWLLAVLLLPWVAVLASPHAARFFPSDSIRAAWIAFDTAMFIGLAALAHTYERPLALAVAIAASLDLAAGFWQLAAWNVAHASGIDWLFIVVSLLAPLLASGFLWALVLARRAH